MRLLTIEIIILYSFFITKIKSPVPIKNVSVLYLDYIIQVIHPSI